MLEALLAGAFGLLIGSFLNVCIYRWPRDLSVVRPRSHCPECDEPISWYDNIPIFSFLILGGRCRYCRAPISLRYPAVELLTAAFFGWFVLELGMSGAAARWCVFSAILVSLAFADAETRVLPDELTLGGIGAGFLFAIAVPVLPQRLLSVGESVLGAVIPSGALWLAGWLFAKVRHKEGLGFGDVKMTAMIGSFVGLKGALLTLAIGSTLGSVIGLAYIAIAKKDAGSYELPLGTFLAAGGLLYAVFGQPVMDWYGSLY